MCGFFAVGKQFISVLYGDDKVIAWIYALISIVPMFVNMTNSVIINILDIINKRLIRSLALLGTTIANIVLTVILIGKLGIIGAVIATAVTMIIGNIILLNVYYQKKLGIKILYLFFYAYKGILIFQILSGVIVFFIAQLFTNDIIALLVGGILFLVLSFSLFAIFGLNDYEKSKLEVFIYKFKRKK